MEQGSAELFTVQQFALQVGKTSQAIYQQARGKLKPYVRKGESGQVYITADALKLYKVDKPTEAAAVDKDIQALQSENTALKAEIASLREQLAREQEISRERLDRALNAEQTNRELIVRFPPQLPAGNAGGGLFGWLKRKKGDTNT